MLLLNPKKHTRHYPDERSREVILKTIEFFETRGREQLRVDYHAKAWYAEFLEFVKRERIFATMCTPAGYGAEDARWDTWRICEFAEVLGFYGLQYWYTWQVSVLGLGPIWMSDNEAVKQKTAALLEDGGIFAFGLSERAHGADIYSSSMTLTPQADGTYRANGGKYYIGNGNKAAIVSTFGKLADSGEYVFFTADPQHEAYELVRNVVNSQSYVAQYNLHDYPVTEADILFKGQAAWDAALNTVNVGKYNLGWASIGMCTHAFYEALDHASARRLYNMYVTDFAHVRRMFVDAYARLHAMKLFALRAADYFRSASAEDRRYLLYNPMVKMKVTTQGEDVINLLWDVIAAKGFEKDTYFEEAAVAIRGLPKLEGTVHVNIALMVKFMANFFFNPAPFDEVPKRDDAANDSFLFDQGPTRGLSKIRFHDYKLAYALYDLPNVNVFEEQIEVFRTLLATAGPTEAQQKDIDYLLAGGEIFALVVYGQLVLENARIYDLGDDMVDEIFDFMVRDFSERALKLHNQPSTTDKQMALCMKMLRKPVPNAERYQRVWQDHVCAERGVYFGP
ncbi:MAG: acyl-CoA dehydrogenase [Myxococcales bacterium]|nr:acyl-CoA dehydrogenase [Myxococcales bacterium]MCB9625868.1 acyl-CoA dehydrogenase [Sandaracinaceae bacterium]